MEGIKRIDYLKPNNVFFDAVHKATGGAYNYPDAFEERENSVIIRVRHYNGAGYKLIEVDKKDIDKYFALDTKNEETIKI